MEHSFWLERWEQGQIGFHQPEVHPDLKTYRDPFLGGGPHRILVPLCGKSLDLGWLVDEGHTVVGVELSEIAVRALFEERGLTPEITAEGGLNRYQHGSLIVLQGDFFAASPAQVGPIDRVWDRASMVALPPALRARYVPHLRSLAKPGARILLNTLSYDPAHFEGPPFSIPEPEVRERYAGAEVKRLQQRELIDDEPRWRERGLKSLLTTTYLITEAS